MTARLKDIRRADRALWRLERELRMAQARAERLAEAIRREELELVGVLPRRPGRPRGPAKGTGKRKPWSQSPEYIEAQERKARGILQRVDPDGKKLERCFDAIARVGEPRPAIAEKPREGFRVPSRAVGHEAPIVQKSRWA